MVTDSGKSHYADLWKDYIFGGLVMKQNDGIAYEKPELIEYSLYGIVNGGDGTSVQGDVNVPGFECSAFIDE